MSLDNTKLLDFLGELDKELSRKITVVAAGGTAMTLLNAKPSTVDVDFTIPKDDYDEFGRVLKIIPHGFKVDSWPNGMVFSQMLPEDYLEKSIPIRTKTRNVQLRALHPVDIVVTKIGRLNERDKQDIEACIRKFKLTRRQIIKRAKEVQYVGRQENYEINLQYVIKELFEK